MKLEIIAVAMAVVGFRAFACTGMYAGRQVTTDGTVLIGRTVDYRPFTCCHRFVANPAVKNKPGRGYSATPDGFTWPLPPTTYAYVATPALSSEGRGAMDSACANEKGFVISGTVTAHATKKILEIDPMVTGGAGETSLPGLIAQCCATSREALDLMARVIAKKGHNGGEIYMFADRDEAWYVEVYSGHQWAAVRMPEDKVACFGNQFMLREFDPASPDTRHSPDLITVPEKAGTLVRLDGGKIDLYRSYCGKLDDNSNYRTWFGHHTWSPATAGKYAIDAAQPLFYSPSRKIGLRDMFELQRTRYEGTDHDASTNQLITTRVIGTTRQATCHVLQFDAKLPSAFAGTLWATTGAAEHGVFLPLNAAVTTTHSAYFADQKAGWQQWSSGVAGNWFRRLAALAEKDRFYYGSGVRAFWRAREDELLKNYPRILSESVKKNSAKAITAWTVSEEGRALADAKAIADELSWYMVANNNAVCDGFGGKAKPDAPFKPYARVHKTKVLFFFDTEDFTCDESNDAIRDIANILHEEGVRGQFAMIGELGNFLVEKKRTDVIDALKHHLIGNQTLYHSKHPNIVEYGDVSDYAAAYARTMREEKLSFEILERTLGQKTNWCSVFPGNANSYVGLYVHSELGSPFFGGGNLSFTPGEREAAWFVNQFHLPYYKKLHLESFIPPAPMIDIAARLDELATHEYVTLYMHPHMALSKQHWDGPNFNPRDPVKWGDWRPTPKRDNVDVKIYYDRLRTLVRALKRDVRFEVTDCEKLYATFRPRRKIGAKDLGRIRKALDRRLGPIDSAWCVADVFQAVVKLLRGEKEHVPGRVYGFLGPPKGVTRQVSVRMDDLKSAAAKLDLNSFIPPEIAVGGVKIGPADFLYAALEALDSGKDEVQVSVRDQLGPIHLLMPTLATYSMKGGWPLYEDTFEDKYLTPRLRLQLWTLRYED